MKGIDSTTYLDCPDVLEGIDSITCLDCTTVLQEQIKEDWSITPDNGVVLLLF